MGYAQRRAAIVGVYTTEQARFMDRTGISLQLESIKGALDDAGLTPGVVDGLIPLDEAPAALAISAGLCNVAVLFWGKAGWQLGPRGTAVPDRRRADPLHLLDCALDNDGGYAIVMAAEDIA